MEGTDLLLNSLIEKHPQGTVLTEHHLEALFYHHFPSHFTSPALQSRYKNQWIHNTILLDELASMSVLMRQKGLEATLLKGAHLLEDLYPDVGSRFMSDIDLLIAPQDQIRWSDLLVEKGFKEIKMRSFYGNHFKSEWSKMVGEVEVNFELHTQLFFHIKNEDWNFRESNIPGFKKLSREDCLIHLCGHLAFQHNFQKLYWLFDIYFYLEKFSPHLDWNYIYNKSKQMHLLQSVRMCLWVYSRYMNLGYHVPETLVFPRVPWWHSLLDVDFLLSPEKNKLKYFLIKHATKDHLSEALYYDLTWFWHYKILKR